MSDFKLMTSFGFLTENYMGYVSWFVVKLKNEPVSYVGHFWCFRQCYVGSKVDCFFDNSESLTNAQTYAFSIIYQYLLLCTSCCLYLVVARPLSWHIFWTETHQVGFLETNFRTDRGTYEGPQTLVLELSTRRIHACHAYFCLEIVISFSKLTFKKCRRKNTQHRWIHLDKSFSLAGSDLLV